MTKLLTKQHVKTRPVLLPVLMNTSGLQWLAVGGSAAVHDNIKLLLQNGGRPHIKIVSTSVSPELLKLKEDHRGISIHEREYTPEDLAEANMLIIGTGDVDYDVQVSEEAALVNIRVCMADQPENGDFVLAQTPANASVNGKQTRLQAWGLVRGNSDQSWKNFTTKLILVFTLMVIGHFIISYLPLPSVREVWGDVKPYFDYKFLFFVTAGFLAQMVDGSLGMGYGVTSATCLITFGVSPVMVSSAIHTSEIFTTGISGYSHYKFGNVNKKLFRHLVIPGVIGSILGAVMLVFLGDRYGKWLMPVIAAYALFLGIKILVKAFQIQSKDKKIRRIGWLAWVGGFLDAFGGGGWGPIVTSSLISKGRSPKYTIGSVNLTEFFVTLASAVTFFISVGVSNWNVVLGLLIGGGIASPLAAKLAGKLPRKTMMIGVGIIVIIWCIRMLVKSFI